MAAIMPAMVIIGLAKTIPILYAGLTLFSFGKWKRSRVVSSSGERQNIVKNTRARSKFGGHAK